MLKIGGILQARMVQKDMKQKELANLLNVDQRTISSYCKNISFPNLETLSAICEILELDLNELLQIHAKGNEELLIHDDIELSLLQHFRKLPNGKKRVFAKSMAQLITLLHEED